MPIFIPISCLKINPEVICPQSGAGDRWGVPGQDRRWCHTGRRETAPPGTCTPVQGARPSRCGERKRFRGLNAKNAVTEGDACSFWLFGVKGAPLPARYLADLFFRHQRRIKF